MLSSSDLTPADGGPLLLAPEWLMRPEGAQRGWAVAVQGGRFTHVGPRDHVQAAHPGCSVIALPQHLLMPGLVDTHTHLTQAFGVACSGRYWTIFERLRDELGYADYLGALQLYRAEVEGRGAQAQALLQMSGFLVDYPFADRLFPGALDAVARMRRLGPCVILSDGDVVFQPRKVQRSGLWQAVEGRVLIYVHKERRLDEVRRTFPARRYLLVDDKPRILGAVKAEWREDVVTVFPRQGHYAADAAEVARHPRPDVVIDRIGELARMNLAAWLPAAGAPNDTQHAAAT